MKKRFIQLLLGFFCLNISIQTFPSIEQYTLSGILYNLVFQPFSWLGSILLFIVGFLLLARLLTNLLANKRPMKRLISEEWIWCLLLVGGFIYLALDNFIASIVALSVSLFYGIMDANEFSKSRYFDR